MRSWDKELFGGKSKSSTEAELGMEKDTLFDDREDADMLGGASENDTLFLDVGRKEVGDCNVNLLKSGRISCDSPIEERERRLPSIGASFSSLRCVKVARVSGLTVLERLRELVVSVNENFFKLSRPLLCTNGFAFSPSDRSSSTTSLEDASSKGECAILQSGN